MYIDDLQLKKRISEIAEEIWKKSSNTIRYEEFIALPYYGQIILRFTVLKESITINDLDNYEQLMRNISGDDFLVDFMGSVYRKVGVDYSNQQKQYAMLGEIFRSELILPSIHHEPLLSDARSLLKAAGLDENTKVWEIQIDDDGLILLILGTENKELTEIDGKTKITVVEAEETSCTGLMKAVVYAKRCGISLGRVLLDHPPLS